MLFANKCLPTNNSTRMSLNKVILTSLIITNSAQSFRASQYSSKQQKYLSSARLKIEQTKRDKKHFNPNLQWNWEMALKIKENT